MKSFSRMIHFALLLLCTLVASQAFAVVGSGISYQGRILKPDGTVESDSAVQFRIQVRTPGTTNCLMYEETQSFDMSSSEGSFALTVNGTSSSRTDASGYSLDSIFSNSSGFTFAAPTCTGANTYIPALSDGRVLSVSFKDSGMSSWEAMPSQALNYVPMALQAKAVAGFDATSLVRVQESNGTLDVVSPLNNAQYNELLALIGGTSSQYTKAGQLNGVSMPSMTSGQVLGWNGTAWTSSDPLASLPSFAKTSLPVCGANTFLKDDGAGSLTCVAVAGASGGTVTSITAGTGLSGGAITSVGTISVAAGGITNTELASNAVHSGNIQDGSVTTAKLDPAVNVVTSGSISTSGNISAANVSATGLSSQTLNIFETTNHFAVTIQASASLGANYSLTLPLAAGTNGQVLSTSGGGVLTWTTVTGVTPGGAAGGDLSGTYPNPQVAKLQGSSVSTVTPGASSVLRFVSGAWTPSFVNFADVKSSGGLQQFPATCTAGQTLTYASGTDTFVCTNISVDASAIATGILPVANGGTGSSNGSIAGSGALTFAAGGSNQNVTIAPSGTGKTVLNGKVGIGTTVPSSPLDINGDLVVRQLGDATGTNQVTFDHNGTAVTMTNNNTNTAGNQTNFIFTGPRNGGGTLSLNFDSSGQLISSYPSLRLGAGSGTGAAVVAGGLEVKISGAYLWSTDSNTAGTADTGLARNAAGVVEINNGTAGQYRDLQLRAINPTSGNVGIGMTSPSAALQLRAGTASASTAPLKFTSGPVLTTAEAGAVEFDGTNLYYTDSSNARQTLATTSGTSSFSGVTTISNSAGDITLAPKASTNGVAINSTTASTSSTTGALKVSGGAGVTGDIFAGATINAGTTLTAGTSLITPQIYGVSPATGNIKIDGTSNATKGYVLLNSAGGNVGIGTSSPASVFSVGGSGQLMSLGDGANTAAYINFDVNRGFAGFNGGNNAMVIQSGTSKSLQFGVNNATFGSGAAMTIDGSGTSTNGYVGIGTASPYSPLEVYTADNSVYASGSDLQHLYIMNGSTTNGIGAGIHFQAVGGGAQVAAGNITLVQTASGSGDFTFSTRSSGTFGERMRISAAGNVGIGTTTPAQLLEVNGSAQVDSNLTVAGTATIGGATGKITTAANNGYGVLNLTDGSGTRTFTIFDADVLVLDSRRAGIPMAFYTANAERMRLDSSGNLGIGSTSPSAVLNLKAGTIAAGTAPLKFTSGPVLTTAEAGAVEFDGTNLYYTNSSNARQTLATTSGTSSFSGVTSISNSAGDITLAPKSSTGGVAINSATASTSSTTGALKVTGGVGVSGDIFAGATINAGTTLTAGTSLITPQIYGVSPATGNIKIDGTSNATKGYVLLNSAGGNVGIGTTTPTSNLQVVGSAAIGQGYGVFNVTGSLFGTSYLGGSGNTVVGFATNPQSSPEALYGLTIPAQSSDLIFPDSYGYDTGYGHNIISMGVLNVKVANTVNAMSFLTNGNVGIGTTNPSAALHVTKDPGAAWGNSQFILDNPTGGSGSRVGIDFSGHQVADGEISYLTNIVAASRHLSLSAGNAESDLIITGEGKVGIGTTSPNATMEILPPNDNSPTAYPVEALRLTGSEPTSCSGGAKQTWYSAPGGYIMGALGFYQGCSFTNPGMTLQVADTSKTLQTRMTIDSGGSVGIGTAGPGTQLDIWKTQAADTSVRLINQSTTGSVSYNQGSDAAGMYMRSNGSALAGTSFGLSNVELSQLVTYGSSSALLLGTSGNAPIVFGTNLNERMRIIGAGYVGIGTTAPTSMLEIQGEGANYAQGSSLFLNNQNNTYGGNSTMFGIYNARAAAGGQYYFQKATNPSGTMMSLDSSGNLIIAGTLTQASDARLKTNIVAIPDSLKKIDSLNGVNFDWKDKRDSARQIGLIAQDVEKVFPEAVHDEKDGFKSVNYSGLVGPIINAIKEIHLWLSRLDSQHSDQARDIASLKSENEKLKQESADKSKELSAIKSYLCAKDPSAALCH